MGYIGQQPAKLALTSSDIADGVVGVADLGANSVDSSELVNGSVDIAHLSASGTASSSNFLRGDNAWTAVSGFDVTSITGATALSSTLSAGGNTVLGGILSVNSGFFFIGRFFVEGGDYL